MTSNVDAIYAEYPFLEKIHPRAKTVEAQVRRFDDDFMSQTAVIQYDDRFTYRFYLLDEHGEIVARVGEPLTRFTRFLNRTSDETAGQALARIGSDTRRVRHAVFVGESRTIPTTLYKLPNGFDNASDWLQSHIADGRKELKEE